MPDFYDWQMARRVARLAAHAPGRGLPRWELIAAMPDPGGFDKWVGLAYRRGWVDCVRDYVVAPTPGDRSGGLCWLAEPPLCYGLCGPRGRPPMSPRPCGRSPRGEPFLAAADAA